MKLKKWKNFFSSKFKLEIDIYFLFKHVVQEQSAWTEVNKLSRKSFPATAISLTDLKHRSFFVNFYFSFGLRPIQTLSILKVLFVSSSCSSSNLSRFILAKKWYCVSQFNYIDVLKINKNIIYNYLPEATFMYTP